MKKKSRVISNDLGFGHENSNGKHSFAEFQGEKFCFVQNFQG